MGPCSGVLSHQTSAPWVFEGDSNACVDERSQAGRLAHIPMEQAMLRQGRHAGSVAEDQWYPTAMGTPHGGILSPALAHRTRDGLARGFARHLASTNTRQRRNQVPLVR